MRKCIPMVLILLVAGIAWSGTPDDVAGDRDPLWTETTQEITPYMMYDPPIDLNVYKSSDTWFGYSEDQTASDNDHYDLVRDVIGINIINEAEVSVAAYEQKVKLAISTNDIPDLVATEAADFDTMIENDMLVDLAPYIDAYMSPEFREAMFAFDGAMVEPVSRGDAIYGIPATGNVQGNLRVAWIRRDWREAVGREIPTTMEQLLDLAVAFATEDPDGNGVDDTFGLAMSKEVDWLVNTFEIVSNAYGYYPFRFIKDEGGQVVNGNLDPGIKDVLQIFQDLTEVGALDPEWPVKDFQQVDADVAAGKLGLWLGVFWKPVDPGMATTYQEGVQWDIIQIPGSETVGEYRPFVPFPTVAWYGISEDYAHPEALVIMLNHYFTTHFDFTKEWAQGWRRISNLHVGIPINNWGPVQLQNPTYFDSSPLKRALDDPDFDPENPAYPIHGQSYDILTGRAGADDVTVHQFTDIFLEAVARMEEYPQSSYVFPGYTGSNTETMQRQGSLLKDRLEEKLAAVITGRDTVESYDDFIEEYLSLGGQDILDEINAQ